MADKVEISKGSSGEEKITITGDASAAKKKKEEAASKEQADKQLFEEGFILGEDVLDSDIQQMFKDDPKLAKEVLGDLKRRELEFSVLSKNLKIMQDMEVTRAKTAESRYTALSRDPKVTPEELNAARDAMYTDPRVAEQMTTMQSRMTQLLSGEDLIEQTRQAQPQESIELGKGFDIPQDQLNLILNDPNQLQDLFRALNDEGNVEGAEKLAELAGRGFAQSMNQTPSGAPAVPVPQNPIKPLNNPQAIGGGNADENIKESLKSIMTGGLKQGAQAAVTGIASSLKSERNKKGLA